MFVGQLVAPETDDGHQWHFHPLAGGRNARQHPIHPHRVRELENHFIHELIGANSSRDRSDLGVGWHLRNEPLGIELAQRIFADASCQNGNVIDVSIINHGGEGVLGVSGGKLVSHVFVPEVAQKFRVNVRLGAGLKFVIHISNKKTLTGSEANNRTTRLLTTDDGPQDEAEKHRTPNAERRTPNMRTWQGAKGKGRRNKSQRTEDRGWRAKIKGRRAKGEERRANRVPRRQDYGPRDGAAKRSVISDQGQQDYGHG